MPKKMLEGTVVNNRSDKTVSVLVERKVLHPKYKKIAKISKKYQVHDENNEFNIGDKIKIVESSPISKCKKWQVSGRVR